MTSKLCCKLVRWAKWGGRLAPMPQIRAERAEGSHQEKSKVRHLQLALLFRSQELRPSITSFPVPTESCCQSDTQPNAHLT